MSPARPGQTLYQHRAGADRRRWCRGRRQRAEAGVMRWGATSTFAPATGCAPTIAWTSSCRWRTGSPVSTSTAGTATTGPGREHPHRPRALRAHRPHRCRGSPRREHLRRRRRAEVWPAAL